MGSIITAKCNKCDFIKKDIYIGCGMTDHKVFAGYPYSCYE